MIPITISAKTLGAVALADFCPRCFWLKQKIGNRLPFQIFPGIFSSIDSYNKKIVHGHIDRHGAAPAWLSQLGDITAYHPLPHYSKYSFTDPATDITLRGSPDAIYERKNGSVIIADYKTSRHTKYQDKLLPMYEIQLNAYAYIAHKTGLLSPVTDLALIYFEPQTGETDAHDGNISASGFSMAFSAMIKPIDLDPENKIPPLLQQVRQIVELPAPPKGAAACEDCVRVDALAFLIS